ncbi:MAG: magnesium transporter [Proteobacteria bacterium]|nr:magnesium transporter [Pseudomonadota bacterium]
MKDLISRNLSALIEAGRNEELRDMLADLHPADVAEVLEAQDAEVRSQAFALLDIESASEVLLELSELTREQVLAGLPVEQVTELVAEMDSDDAADIVADLSDADAAAVLASIEPEDSAEVRRLLLYDEDTAGGIMQVELVSVREEETVSDAVERIRAQADEVINLNYVFVVDETERLGGLVSLRQLLLARPDQTIRELVTPCKLVVGVEEDQEEVARKFRKYDVRSAPVVDGQGRLIGRITVDDVVDVFMEEANEDFYRMAGTSEEETASDRVLHISRLRLPWLLTNLTGGLITGYLIWNFKLIMDVQDVLALVTFIPAIMALGGSVGIQSSTIVVRSLALGRIGHGQIGHLLFKEFRVALIMGLVCGTGGALVAHFWHGRAAIGLVVGLSMMLAIMVAALLGVVAPALFKRLNIDPALASGPFVTMSNDIMGILLYMGIATFLLNVMP